LFLEILEGVGEDWLQCCQIDRLLQEVEDAETAGLNGVFKGAMCGEDEHGWKEESVCGTFA